MLYFRFRVVATIQCSTPPVFGKRNNGTRVTFYIDCRTRLKKYLGTRHPRQKPVPMAHQPQRSTEDDVCIENNYRPVQVCNAHLLQPVACRPKPYTSMSSNKRIVYVDIQSKWSLNFGTEWCLVRRMTHHLKNLRQSIMLRQRYSSSLQKNTQQAVTRPISR